MINLFTVSISSGLLTAMKRANPVRASLLMVSTSCQAVENLPIAASLQKVQTLTYG